MLWKRNGGSLFNNGLKQGAAAQRLGYLMRRWSADNAPSRFLRTEQAAAKKTTTTAASSKQGAAADSDRPATGKPKKSSSRRTASKAATGKQRPPVSTPSPPSKPLEIPSPTQTRASAKLVTSMLPP